MKTPKSKQVIQKYLLRFIFVCLVLIIITFSCNEENEHYETTIVVNTPAIRETINKQEIKEENKSTDYSLCKANELLILSLMAAGSLENLSAKRKLQYCNAMKTAVLFDLPIVIYGNEKKYENLIVDKILRFLELFNLIMEKKIIHSDCIVVGDEVFQKITNLKKKRWLTILMLFIK